MTWIPLITHKKILFISSHGSVVLFSFVTLCVQANSHFCSALCHLRKCVCVKVYTHINIIYCLCVCACVNLTALSVGLTWTQGEVLNEVLWRKSHDNISGVIKTCQCSKCTPVELSHKVNNVSRKQIHSLPPFFDKITEQMNACFPSGATGSVIEQYWVFAESVRTVLHGVSTLTFCTTSYSSVELVRLFFRAPGGILTGNMAPKHTAQKLWCKLRGINWVCYALVLQKRQVLWAECHLVIVKKQYMAYSQSKSVINGI